MPEHEDITGVANLHESKATLYDASGGEIISSDGSEIFIKEQAAAASDRAGYGQIWVKSDTPNNLYFTDDAGNDIDLTAVGAGDFLADGTVAMTGNLNINTQDIEDANSNELLSFTTTASAVNEFTIANAATSGAPVLSATGGDTNIGITLTPKGAGNVTLGTMVFDADQSIGAGQDNYVLTYDDGTGLISLEAAAGGGGGATTALDNLASVAINTSLISDTDATDDLGSSSIAWKRLYLEAGTTTDIPLNIEASSGQTANLVNVTTNGGTAGDLFKISSGGVLTSKDDLNITTSYGGVHNTAGHMELTAVYGVYLNAKTGDGVWINNGNGGSVTSGYLLDVANWYAYALRISYQGASAFTALNAGIVPVSITGAASQTANMFNLTSNGGSAGDLFRINSAGQPGWATHTPSSASDTGTAGQIAWDGSYIYVCTATDTWQRVAHATW